MSSPPCTSVTAEEVEGKASLLPPSTGASSFCGMVAVAAASVLLVGAKLLLSAPLSSRGTYNAQAQHDAAPPLLTACGGCE